ncbi:MAG TPA: DNA polymerase ligase N-terminal domain-containing protein [Candidatus Limnocylindria bacterium]|nr:DNA polymerase ligase N-terminal domain-containing protein [Candidatus Limnocylindria bacterium]
MCGISAKRRQGLAVYERKRDFARTPEPPGRRAKRKGPLGFVVQKHRATALHYDFRLEAGGTLRSWAVPKGPSLDPKQKRLAMEVEDHPLEYASFEGVIPAGEYGGGTVMIWDEGVWAPMDDVDPVRELAGGELRFVLVGKKLKGSWTLVHTGDRRWLLMKRRDEYASTDDIEETEPRSVRTKRLLAEIAHDAGGDVAKAATGDPVAAKRGRGRTQR